MTLIDRDQLKLILKGKPEVTNTFVLTIEFQGGSMDTNGNWLPVFPDSADIQIALDQTVLHSSKISTTLTQLDFHIPDTVQQCQRSLKISLSGINGARDRDDLNPMLFIKNLWIENVREFNVVNVFDINGTYCHASGESSAAGNFMGCDGYQEIKFTTPVYQWLLENYTGGI